MRIVDSLKEYCDNNDITFYIGLSEYQNYAGDQERINKILLLDPITFQGDTWEGTWTEDDTFTTTIALGCKSSIAENYDQKQERYLDDLYTELKTIIKYLICNDNIRLESVTGVTFINKFDVNIDGVSATITFKYD